MRTKLLTSLFVAGLVAGCASNPPPPPPMAEAPPAPAPAPVPTGATDGTYKGTAELASDAPSRCHKMTSAQTVRVRNQAFAIAGLRAKIMPDGTIAAPAHRHDSLTGTANNNTLDMMLMQGKCSYHYTLSNA